MLPGPSGLYKPLLGMVWVGYLILLFEAVLTHKVTLSGALVQLSIVSAVYLVWSTGAYFYITSNDFQISGSYVLTKIKGKLIWFSSSLFYVLIFLPFLLVESNNRYQKALLLSLFAFFSLIWALSLYRRIRLIEDTVPTRLSSAAQGYAELEGKVLLYDNETARGPHREMPIMVWYAKRMISSTAGFILEDENGRCTIDPRDAEVITPSYRYNDHSYKAIYPGEKIYVLGYLETLNKHRTEYERQTLIRKKIVEWKQNHLNFLDLFDKNHSGNIDDNEMQTVRNTAENLVDNQLEEIYQAPATHIISRPDDGRPFLLSSIHPDKLLKKYKISLWIHIFIWFYLSILVLAMQVG